MYLISFISFFFFFFGGGGACFSGKHEISFWIYFVLIYQMCDFLRKKNSGLKIPLFWKTRCNTSVFKVSFFFFISLFYYFLLFFLSFYFCLELWSLKGTAQNKIKTNLSTQGETRYLCIRIRSVTDLDRIAHLELRSRSLCATL